MKRSTRLLAALTFGLMATPFAHSDSDQADAPTSDAISESAAVYATFHADVSDVKDKPLGSASDIETSLTNLGGQNPDQLTGGWIAYSALVAAQDPQYRASVRDIESFYGRDSLLLGLQNDMRYARTLDGGPSAVAAALSATEADADRIKDAGAYVKEQAYSLQAKSWAKARVGNTDRLIDTVRTTALAGRPARSAFVVALAEPDIDTVLTSAGRAGAPSLWENVSMAADAVRLPDLNIGYSAREARIRAGKEPIADRIATLAAYRVLGADETPAHQVRTAMKERQTSGCLKMAQLNLQQCVAAAHKQYEVPFCIGEHALNDVGACIGEVTQ